MEPFALTLASRVRPGPRAQALAHVLSHLAALAAISSVCLLFIGDGCVSWVTSAFSRRDGYSAVSAQEEIEMEEKVILIGIRVSTIYNE